MQFGSIEAGGTKFVLGVADENMTLLDRYQFPTTTPQEVVPQIIQYFQKFDLDGIGIGAFGPVDINPDSPDYGTVLSTPKPGWQQFNLFAALKAQLDVPMYLTTDVNVAAYGEAHLGAARGKHNVVYLTVGTGIGAGVINHDQFYFGHSHTEVGHMLLQKHPDDDFAGVCPYHGANCAEGLASGPAIQARFNEGAQALAATDPFWAIEADYLAQLCVNVTLSLTPDIIVIGGGVAKQTQLFPLIRDQFKTRLNGYVDTPGLTDYIVPVGLGDNAGITGALLLAQEAANA